VKENHIEHEKGGPSMKNYSRESRIAKAGLVRFCTKMSKGLGRPDQKLVMNMVYGIAAGNSCHLTEIGRALEEGITLKKTVDRLSLGLKKFEGRKVLRKNYLEIVEKYIDDTTIFPIDESDTAKPHSRAMEALHPVRDGSTGEIVPGYMTLEIAALTHQTKTPLPVYERVYSAAENGFISQGEEVLKGLSFLSKRFGHSGFRVLDRGYDANVYMKYFIKAKEKFIIRVRKNRTVRHGGKQVNIEELAGRYKGKYAFRCMLHGETIHMKIAEIPINLYEFGEYPLYLVCVYGFGKKPMLLITNCRGEGMCVTIAKMYLLRWKIEEHFRFKKQQYNFEDFRVRSLNAIRTLHLLVTVLAGYLALLTQVPNAVIFCVLKQAARPIPRSKKRRPKRFFHYELASGFAILLRKTSANLKALFPPVRFRPLFSQLSFLSKRQWLDLLSACPP
jgi:hypothetical protein